MFSNLLNEVDIECNRDYRNYKKDDNLSTSDELLFDIEEAQEPYRAQFKDKYETREFDNIIKYFAQNDCNHVSIFESKQRRDKNENSSSNSSHLNSCDSTCEKQGGRHYFSTPPTMAGSEVGYDP